MFFNFICFSLISYVFLQFHMFFSNFICFSPISYVFQIHMFKKKISYVYFILFYYLHHYTLQLLLLLSISLSNGLRAVTTLTCVK
jgi:hypothetical protein